MRDESYTPVVPIATEKPDETPDEEAEREQFDSENVPDRFDGGPL